MTLFSGVLGAGIRFKVKEGRHYPDSTVQWVNVEIYCSKGLLSQKEMGADDLGQYLLEQRRLLPS